MEQLPSSFLAYEGVSGYQRVTSTAEAKPQQQPNATPTAAAPATASAAAATTPTAAPDLHVRLVLQRADSCKFLLEADTDAETWVQTGAALLVYVSFTKEMELAARHEQQRLMEQAAKAVLHFPIMTHGQWGDGTKTLGAAALAIEERATPGAISLVVVPQASLCCKIKPDGRGASYRSLADKEVGAALYASFVQVLTSMGAVALQAAGAGGGGGGSEKSGGDGKAAQAAQYELEAAKKRAAALIPPDQLFRTGEHAGAYSAYDARGVPTADAAGEPLAKNALKKLEKTFATHCKNHDKEVAKGGVPAVPAPEASAAGPAAVADAAVAKLAEDAPLKVVAGSYGRRQGLSIEAACGPFSHMVDL